MSEGSRSSSRAAAAWVRLVLPSAADLIFVALLSVLVFTPLSVRLLGDAGIGWHIRAGQQILSAHAVPHADSFSSTMSGQPWFAWEWLYDLAVGVLEAKLGLNGVVWFTAVVIGAVFAWTFWLLIARGVNVLVAVVLVLLSLSASMIHFLARPHVVSWLFTLAWFWILDTYEREGLDGRRERRGKQLWLLPLLMLVWVNVHGGFVIGFVLLAMYWLGAVWEWFRSKEGRIEELLQKIAAAGRARSLMWIGFLSVLASFVNPYGWKLHEHIYAYLSNRFLMDHIDEFQSPNFHGVAQRCFLVLLIVAVSVLTVRGRELRMSGILTMLFTVYAGLYASRNIPVSSVLLVMIVGPLLRGAVPTGFLERMTKIEGELGWHLWPIVAALATAVIAANGGRIGTDRIMDAHFDAKRVPVEAVNYLEQHGLKGPVLSPDSWGGYLIYRLYPRAQVVVDDRHDLYGEQFLKSYLKLMRVEPGWGDFLREHPSACLLLPKNAALSTVLHEQRGWKAIYSDDVGVVFIPSSENP